ncbi:MAG: hypothetical protein U5N58_05530 [Actinomycetota bacterium]|nr:hypothetical protein [Actinomycetota bacterium]
MEVAEKVASQHDCRLAYLEIEYDWVQAAVEKQIGLALVDKFISGAGHIRSVSKSRVIYPWDYGFNYCDYYKFDYRED